MLYALIGVNSTTLKNFKANIIYFMAGFASSIIFLLGITLLNILEINFLFTKSLFFLNLDWTFILIAIFIKSGFGPFIKWVDYVYTDLNNNSIIIFFSIVNLNFLNFYLFLFLYYFKISFIFLCLNLCTLFIILTLVQGSNLLSKQYCIKGFLGISSVLNYCFVLISCITILYNYNKIINPVFKSFIIKLTQINPWGFLYAKNNWIETEYYIAHNFTELNIIILKLIYLYIFIYIINNVLIFLFWIGLYKKNKTFNIKQKTYFKNLTNQICNVKDYMLFLFVWVLGGFPPFLLFIFKFLILFYLTLFLNQSVWLFFLIFLFFNSFILYGYLKVLLNLFVKLK